MFKVKQYLRNLSRIVETNIFKNEPITDYDKEFLIDYDNKIHVFFTRGIKTGAYGAGTC